MLVDQNPSPPVFVPPWWQNETHGYRPAGVVLVGQQMAEVVDENILPEWRSSIQGVIVNEWTSVVHFTDEDPHYKYATWHTADYWAREEECPLDDVDYYVT